jgi:integrase
MAENVGRRGESWFFRVDLPPGPDGKRRQKRVGGFATEREARRALAQSKVDIDTGRLRRTVAELAAEWLEAVRPNRKASTFSNYGWLMREVTVSEYVFVDEFGDPYHPAQLTRDLHSLQHRAGLPEITLHDLRHTAATVALLAGVHPKVVNERHGHASTQSTLDRYTHALESMQTAAADAIGQFLTT